MKYFIGILWIFVVIFVHILIKYSLRMKISSILLDKEKEKFTSGEYYNKRKTMMEKVDKSQEKVQEKIQEKSNEVEDEDLYAMNLEKYIQNNTGSQVVYNNLESNTGNKYNMTTIDNSPLFNNSNNNLSPFDHESTFSNYLK
jgi:multidrug efflux pump subunit AcrB